VIDDYEEARVRAYSSYRAEEAPREFCVAGEWLEVKEILQRSIREDILDKARIRVFRVAASDGKQYELIHDEARACWFVKKSSGG